MRYLYYTEDGTLFINAKEKLNNNLVEVIISDNTPIGIEVDSEIGKIIKEYTYDEMIASIGGSYVSDRIAEYPSLDKQLDMQYWDAINGTTVWIDTINKIKTKYPKLIVKTTEINNA